MEWGLRPTVRVTLALVGGWGVLKVMVVEVMCTVLGRGGDNRASVDGDRGISKRTGTVVAGLEEEVLTVEGTCDGG